MKATSSHRPGLVGGCRPARRCALRIRATAPTQTGACGVIRAIYTDVATFKGRPTNDRASLQPPLYHEFDDAQLERVNNLAVSMKQCGASIAAVSIVSAGVMAIQLDGAEGTVLAAMGMPLPGADMINPPLAVHAEDDPASALSNNIATFFKTYSVAGITRPVDGLLLAALVVYAAAPFSRVASAPPSRQLRSVLQGVQRLSLVFEQVCARCSCFFRTTCADAHCQHCGGHRHVARRCHGAEADPYLTFYNSLP